MFIAKLVSVSTALSFLLISNFANAENFTIEMLNKLGKERMVYSEKVISIKVNDGISWKSVDKGTRLAIDIASKIKNTAGLILVDGSRFCDYEEYFEVLSNFENSLKQNNYQSLLKNMFSSMFFSESYKKDRNRIVKRAVNIPERYSLPLRRNTIWYDSHCVENNLKSLKLPILVIQSTKIDSKNTRCMINKDDDIYYVNFINNFNKNSDIVLLENTSHYVTFEKPQWINETILSWRIKLKLHFRK